MDKQGSRDQDDLLATLAAIMAQSPTWDEFCDHIVEELQALACCFVFFSGTGQNLTLKPCRVWLKLTAWQQLDYSALWQKIAFYETYSNGEGAYLAVPIHRKRLTGCLLIQYRRPPSAQRAWRSLADIFAHHGALLWQEKAEHATARVFETSYYGIMITNAQHCITEVNSAFTRITGYKAEQVLGKYPYLLKYPIVEDEFYEKISEHLQHKDYWHGEVLSHRKNGQPYSLLLAVSAVKNERNEVLNHTNIFSDISYLKHHEAELRHLAFHDPLTGIPNRLLFSELLEQALAATKRNQDLLAVCYLDLDGFKEVNDRLGHGAGDQLLIEVSRRLRLTTRSCDALSRLGGDEFALLITGLSHGQECEEVLLRIQETICQPVLLKGEPVQISASIGVALYPQDAQEAEQLIHCADQAMYQAKRQGKKQYVFFKDSEDQP